MMTDMTRIMELDANTINQIAAGEVVERPSSVVKELVENAVDAGASAVTVEIKDGGISMIRVTDNGSGIRSSEIGNAFKAHATSKLKSIDDIFSLTTLGFRGEALSSIAAVAKVELITRAEEELTGTRVVYSAGIEEERQEVGAPKGTTIIVRDLFYNTPARRKFLKTPQTEGSNIAELMEHLAMAVPGVSMHFINNNSDRFLTSGNSDLKELIYRIYGRDSASFLIPFYAESDGVKIDGYLGEPSLNRSNRNYELFFVNGRYIKDKTLSKALEEGYRKYLMQHKFPFAVLHLMIDPSQVDVNVHPSKLEVRFSNAPALYDFIQRNIAKALHDHEMIPDVRFDDNEDKPGIAKVPEVKAYIPEPFEESALENSRLVKDEPVFAQGLSPKPLRIEDARDNPIWKKLNEDHPVLERSEEKKGGIIKNSNAVIVEKGVQLSLFDDERIFTEDNRKQYRVLGQVFGTYWLIAYKDKLMIMDQHAAHEKVNYERMIKRYRENEPLSQLVNPPVIVTLSAAEEELYLQFRSSFEKLGFNIENFGGREYAMRAVPLDLYGLEGEKEMFLEVLDELSETTPADRTPDVIDMKIAGMACKASVKGNNSMTVGEVSALLDEMLTLENPYNCPHGRPTIITMSQYELDRKFKRVVS